MTAALELGYEVVDRIEHVGHARPQPGSRTRKGPVDTSGNPTRIATVQQHARRNLSTPLVLLTSKAKRAKPKRAGGDSLKLLIAGRPIRSLSTP
jgi:hypothetical protein